MRDESNSSGDRHTGRPVPVDVLRIQPVGTADAAAPLAGPTLERAPAYMPPQPPPRPSEHQTVETAAIRLAPEIDPRLARTIPRLSSPGSDAAWRTETRRSPPRRHGLVWAASALFLVLAALMMVGFPMLLSRREQPAPAPSAATAHPALSAYVPEAAAPRKVAELPPATAAREASEGTPGRRAQEHAPDGASRTATAPPKPEAVSTRAKSSSKQPSRDVWLK